MKSNVLLKEENPKEIYLDSKVSVKRMNGKMHESINMIDITLKSKNESIDDLLKNKRSDLTEMEQNHIREALGQRLEIADIEYDIKRMSVELNCHKSKAKIFDQTIKARQEELDEMLRIPDTQSHYELLVILGIIVTGVVVIFNIQRIRSN